MKTRKYNYLHVLQGRYSGRWEDLTTTEQTPEGRKEIRQDLKDYQINERGAYRIIRRREKRAET